MSENPCDPALLAGCKMGNVSLVQSVIAKKPDEINKKSASKGLLPLEVAAGFEQPEVVKALLELNASVVAVDNFGMTPLHIAAAKTNIECLQLLLADPKGKEAANMADEDGSTPLHHAAFVGNAEAATELMKAGAQDVADSNGKTAAAEATEKGYDEVAVAIAAGAKAPAEGEPAAAEGEGEGGDEDA